MDNDRWKINIANENNVTLEDVKFIFEQAEKRLDDTVKTGASISSKNTGILTVMTGVIIALSSYVIDKWVSFSSVDNKIFVSFVAVAYISALIAYMIKNILPSHYHVVGSLPQELFVQQFFEDSLERQKQIIYLYMSETENYQFRITHNESKNKNRWICYMTSMIALVIMPFFLAIVYFILQAVR